VYRHLVEEGKVFDEGGQFRSDIEIGEIDVPENVRLIIRRRLERLDENEKQALTAAAVIGRSFSFQLLTAGDRDAALPILEEKRTQLPHSGQQNTRGRWLMLALVIEGLVILGE
jgi:hypothetical protein